MILYALIVVVHVIASICLIIAVLLQAGRGGGLAATFGGGTTQAMFGGRGAGDFLTRATQVLGGTFMVTSFTLFLLGGTLRGGGGVSEDEKLIEKMRHEATSGAPGGPAAAPAQPGGQSVPEGLPPMPSSPSATPPEQAPEQGQPNAGSSSGNPGAGTSR